MLAERNAIQSLLGQVIKDHELRDALEREPERVLGERGLSEADRATLLELGVPRLLAYHDMVHSRLFKTVRTFIGGAAQQLGDERLRADVRRWVAARGPTTPYLRDVAAEFFAWVRPAWEADEALAAWVPELASHQLLIRALRNDPREVGSPRETKLELDAPIVCNPTTQLLRYRFAVHRMSAKPSPDEVPEALDPGHAVVALRSVDGQPRFIDIKPRSAAMLDRLLAGQTLREALFGACEAVGEALDDQILAVTAVTLADLSKQHVLLGGAS